MILSHEPIISAFQELTRINGIKRWKVIIIFDNVVKEWCSVNQQSWKSLKRPSFLTLTFIKHGVRPVEGSSTAVTNNSGRVWNTMTMAPFKVVNTRAHWWCWTFRNPEQRKDRTADWNRPKTSPLGGVCVEKACMFSLKKWGCHWRRLKAPVLQTGAHFITMVMLRGLHLLHSVHQQNVSCHKPAQASSYQRPAPSQTFP